MVSFQNLICFETICIEEGPTLKSLKAGRTTLCLSHLKQTNQDI